MKKILSESLHDYISEREIFKDQVETGLTVDDVDEKEFLLGLTIEKIHSKSLSIQKELVIQNLSKNPKFYSEVVKRGMYDDIEILNTYKKYFLDKEEPKEE